MAKHPNDHDKDKDEDRRQAERRAEEHSQAEEKKRAESRRGEQSVPPGAKPSTGNPLADSALGTLRPEGVTGYPDDRQFPPRQPGPGNDRVVDTGRAPSGTGYPDGEPRTPVPEGVDPRTPAVSSPENPAVPRPEDQTAPDGAATKETRPPAGDELLKGVAKGDLVRLLVPHYDGFQLFAADSIVRWWNDDPPSARNAALPETELTPLNAPPMTDGKPPADYIDPNTGRKPVIGSA